MSTPSLRRDLTFLLEDVLQLDVLLEAPRHAMHDRATVHEVLDVALQIAAEAFSPAAAILDAQEPALVDGRVVLPDATRVAVEAFVEAGFLSASFDEASGGSQLPHLVGQAIFALFGAANPSALAYPGLTMAAASLIAAHGSEPIRQRWLEPMLQGRVFGTMALSEPQAGSSLADLTTLARPAGDGTWRLSGSKMWITAADHDLSENIVHLVLARTPDAPAGTRGISLFLVPRDLQGPGLRDNDVQVIGLNHKMGYRGAVNTVLSLGDGDGAVGWLIGEQHHGLSYMFHMMNEARIAVGLGAAALGCAGYHHALSYARTRPQGRPIAGRDPSQPQIPIVEHADVRRMLLSQKALVEGGLLLSLWCARLLDEARIATDAGQTTRAGEADRLLGVLTPVVKAWNAHYALVANDQAIQVLGGYGYSREYPVERIYRDNRLNPIHEGTNGIQALDLLGRKVMGDHGVAFGLLAQALGRAVARGQAAGAVAAALAGSLEQATERLVQTTQSLAALGGSGDVEGLLCNATPYLHLLGHTVVAWMWLEAAIAAEARLRQGDDPFLQGKLAAASYFFRWELPRTEHWAALLDPVDRTVLQTRPEWL